MTIDKTITAQTSRDQLPDDTETLKSMVLMLLSQIDDLHGQLYYLKRQLFGKKSEKLNAAQRLLFENLYNEVQAKLDQQQKQPKPTSSKSARQANAKHNGRRPLPEHLEREVVEVHPEPADQVCAIHDCAKDVIGTEETEHLEYRPACFYVRKTVRYKYGCKLCDGNISIASLPPRAIDKGVAGESVLAHIITSKFADHLPLNRLEGIFKRHGVEITVSNMCDWVGVSADLLKPVVDRMQALIRQSPVIHTDDTPIPIKSPSRKGSTYNGYLWVYLDKRGNVVFDFTPTRSRQGPIAFIGKDYAGKIQADAYSGYDELFRVSKATEVGCNAHARRKFEYALDSDPVRAARMLALWGQLYAIEKRAQEENFSPGQLLAVRQAEALPIFSEIRAALSEYQDQVLPKSPMGKAIGYAMNQWDALQRYTEDPELSIDNNAAERMLRMVVIGRKNYLFAGSEAGARRAAIIYSLVAACKANGHDPFAYFSDVLRKVTTWPASKIDDLLPSNWTPPAQPAVSKPAPLTDQVA